MDPSLFVYVGHDGWVYYARDPDEPSRIPHDMHAGRRLRSATDAVVFGGFQTPEVEDLFRGLRGPVPDGVRVIDEDFSARLDFEVFLSAVRERNAREFSCLADASDACVADMERRGVLVRDVGSDHEWFRRWYSAEDLRRLFDELRPRWPDEGRAVATAGGRPFTAADIRMEYDDYGRDAFVLGDDSPSDGGEKLRLSFIPVPDVGPDLFVGVSGDWVYLARDPRRPRRIARHMHVGRLLRRIRVVFGEGQEEAVGGLLGCLRGGGAGMRCVRDLGPDARLAFEAFEAAVEAREARSFASAAVASAACVADMESRGVVVRSVGTDPEWFRQLYPDEELDRLFRETRPRWPDEERAVATADRPPFAIEDFQTQYDDNCRKAFDCVEDDGCHFVFNEHGLYFIVDHRNLKKK